MKYAFLNASFRMFGTETAHFMKLNMPIAAAPSNELNNCSSIVPNSQLLKSALIQVRVRPNEDEEATCVLLSDGNFFFVLQSYSMAKSMHLTPIEANEISANHLKPR